MDDPVLSPMACDRLIAFLSQSVPQLEDGTWDHMFLSDFQFGCMALVALGQADELPCGAVPRQTPRLPQILPRWDDLCVTVVSLAEYHGGLEYRRPDGSPRPTQQGNWIIRQVPAPAVAAPNIAAASGLGPARATEAMLDLLQALGLVAQGAWHPRAERVLWRCSPLAWSIDVPSDPRFRRAAAQAVATMPPEVRSRIDQLVKITDADVAEAMRKHLAAEAEWNARYPKRVKQRPPTSEGTRRSLALWRRNDLDWLFFCGWRLGDGWLSPAEAARALQIFHDPVAIAMRQAVLAALHPDKPEFTEF